MLTATRSPGIDPDVRRASDLFKLGAEPTRARLILALASGGLSSAALAEVMTCPKQNLAPHLGLLRTAGVIETDLTREGVVHRLTDERGRALLAAMERLADSHAIL